MQRLRRGLPRLQEPGREAPFFLFPERFSWRWQVEFLLSARNSNASRIRIHNGGRDFVWRRCGPGGNRGQIMPGHGDNSRGRIYSVVPGYGRRWHYGAGGKHAMMVRHGFSTRGEGKNSCRRQQRECRLVCIIHDLGQWIVFFGVDF